MINSPILRAIVPRFFLWLLRDSGMHGRDHPVVFAAIEMLEHWIRTGEPDNDAAEHVGDMAVTALDQGVLAPLDSVMRVVCGICLMATKDTLNMGGDDSHAAYTAENAMMAGVSCDSMLATMVELAHPEIERQRHLS
jgi:hypothetical protein